MGESAWNLTIPPPADYRDPLESITVLYFGKILKWDPWLIDQK